MKGKPKYTAAHWRQLVDEVVLAHWPELLTFPHGALWIEAQIHAESGGNPKAVSGVGAMGLMQLMPATAAELGLTSSSDIADPTKNVTAGVRYMRRMWEALGEVPDQVERLKYAFASYNAGLGYFRSNGGEVNTCLELARQAGQAAGVATWWSWAYGSQFLDKVVFRGRTPHYQEPRNYVSVITSYVELGAR